MIERDFWLLIDAVKQAAGDDQQKYVALLEKRLEAMTSDSIRRHAVYLMQLLQQSSTEEIWAAHYLINGGYEEWGFEDFRYWLVAQGKPFFYDCLANPAEFLCEQVNIEEGDNPELSFYEFWSAFKTAYERKSQRNLCHTYDWLSEYEKVQQAEFSLEEKMRPLAQEYKLRKRYPALFKKFFQHFYYRLQKYQEQQSPSTEPA